MSKNKKIHILQRYFDTFEVSSCGGRGASGPVTLAQLLLLLSPDYLTSSPTTTTPLLFNLRTARQRPLLLRPDYLTLGQRWEAPSPPDPSGADIFKMEKRSNFT